jgi:hypothetical protein
MNHIKEILKNFAWSDQYDEESFAGVLHERCIWDVEKYWKLEAAIYHLAAHPEDFPSLMWPLFRIFSHTMLSFGAHFDPNDAFRMRNATDEQVHDYRERFQLVFEGAFSGEMPDQASLFDTKNPRLEG